MTTARFKRRLGKCYELAGKAALWGDGIDGVPEGAELELVHGTIQKHPHPANPHAWVEYDHPLIGRMVWEPISESHLPTDAFYALYGAVRHHGYTRAAASLAVVSYQALGAVGGRLLRGQVRGQVQGRYP